jgi:hypothetical protein
MLSDAVALDRSKIAVGRGLHTALGLALPLAFASATGYVVEGVAVAAGAMLVGFADRGGTYGTRARLMLTTSALVGASTAIGVATGSNDYVAILLMAVWGFAAGFAAVGGPAATIVGLNTALALLIASDFPADVSEALRRAALVLAGGLLQTVLALVIWPVIPRAPEREAVADACRALAEVAESWPEPRPAAGFAEAASAAEDMLADHGMWASERGAPRPGRTAGAAVRGAVRAPCGTRTTERRCDRSRSDRCRRATRRNRAARARYRASPRPRQSAGAAWPRPAASGRRPSARSD